MIAAAAQYIVTSMIRAPSDVRSEVIDGVYKKVSPPPGNHSDIAITGLILGIANHFYYPYDWTLPHTTFPIPVRAHKLAITCAQGPTCYGRSTSRSSNMVDHP